MLLVGFRVIRLKFVCFILNVAQNQILTEEMIMERNRFDVAKREIDVDLIHRNVSMPRLVEGRVDISTHNFNVKWSI